MKIVQNSDYRIYFDDVRVDPYVKNWSGGCGLNASEANASITMHRTKELENWKGYLTQVRVFMMNTFTGKFSIIFEGEIMSRQFGESRSNRGELTFACKGFYHWLDVPIPFLISREEDLNDITRFRYEAQNINVDNALDFFKSNEDLIMKDKYVEEMIQELFKILNDGYYLDDDTSFAWAKMEDRFKVMGEIIKEFREAGHIDAFTFTRSTQIRTFYVFLNEVLTQLMFEFYQDRDGALRIKPPSWNDSIPKCHVFDESIVANVSGHDNWEREPTRTLVIGGSDDFIRTESVYEPLVNVPMGLYIGKPGEGEFFSQAYQVQSAQFGMDGGMMFDENGNPVAGGNMLLSSNSDFFDNLTGKYQVTSPFGMREHPVDGTWAMHQGTDYNTQRDPILNIGGYGEVVTRTWFSGGGNTVIVKQLFNNERYDFVYMHLNSFDVQVGERVAPGQKIGVSGSTGKVTGPHLHFEIWKGERRKGTVRNPETEMPKLKKIAATTKHHGGGTTGSIAQGSDNKTQVMNMDLGAHTNMSVEQLNNYINPRAASAGKMSNTGAAFKEAERQSGIDAAYLVAHAALESAWGISDIVIKKNNFFGIGAFDHAPFANAHSYPNAKAGIIAGAKFIRERYYDNGQRTLYSMRYNNGQNQYATDKQWPHKIAATMLSTGANFNVSHVGSSVTMPNTQSPFAATGGYTPGLFNIVSLLEDTVRSSSTQRIPSLPTPEGNHVANFIPGVDNQGMLHESPLDYRPIAKKTINDTEPKYDLSNFGDRRLLESRPSGLPADLLALVVKHTSGFKEKYSSSTHKGLMGVPANATTIENISDEDLLDASNNVEVGASIINEAYTRFSDKWTFALAAYYSGDFRIIEQAIEETGTEDFSMVRQNLDATTVNFVDNVMTEMANLHGGGYIEGDPHKPVFRGGQRDYDAAWDTEVKRYEEQYNPIMSDEERRFKVNLRISEQLLIRYDADLTYQTPSEQEQMEDRFGDDLPAGLVSGGDTQRQTVTLDADDMVERYAKYMMQLHRAESHSVNVNLATGVPGIRPGFNAWLEPTRRDVVFYVTRVVHQGSYERGSFTTVSGGFLRDPDSYDSIEDNIFLGETNARARDFGDVIIKNRMKELRNELEEAHNTQTGISTALDMPTISNLYNGTGGKENDYTTMWNGEYTASELKGKVDELYKSAPAVVKTRKDEIATIFKNSEKEFEELMNYKRH